MRPVAKRQSTLRYPLNSILGTEGSVRVLRALSFSSSPRSYSDLARETELSGAGLRRSVSALEKAGLADVLGVSAKRVRLRREHPLSNQLTRLFRAEAETWRDLMEQLQAAFENLDPAPLSAWIMNPEAESTEEITGQLVICVLAKADDVNAIRQSAEPAIVKLEAAQDLMIELRALTRPDLRGLSRSERDRLVRGTPVFGPDPSAFLEDTSQKGRRKKPPYTHAKHDARSLALGEAIAEAISRDPALVDRAHSFVMKRLKRASTSEQHELREWERVLRASPMKLKRLLVDPGERATRLRQTLPFLDALSLEERGAIVASAGDSDPADEE